MHLIQSIIVISSVSRSIIASDTVTRMMDLSLQSGYFANDWKLALVNPLLKKSGLDFIFKNFRPINNLHFMSKLTERAVANQTHDHIDEIQSYV